MTVTTGVKLFLILFYYLFILHTLIYINTKSVPILIVVPAGGSTDGRHAYEIMQIRAT